MSKKKKESISKKKKRRTRKVDPIKCFYRLPNGGGRFEVGLSQTALSQCIDDMRSILTRGKVLGPFTWDENGNSIPDYSQPIDPWEGYEPNRRYH